jgi:hypothetical protein
MALNASLWHAIHQTGHLAASELDPSVSTGRSFMAGKALPQPSVQVVNGVSFFIGALPEPARSYHALEPTPPLPACRPSTVWASPGPARATVITSPTTPETRGAASPARSTRFGADGGPTDGTLNRAQRLEELWRASLSRCKARWTAIGLPPEEAHALAEDRSVGAQDPSMFPNNHQPLVVSTAPLGSGKSIASERYHQECLEGARDDAGGPYRSFCGRRSVSLRSHRQSRPRPERSVRCAHPAEALSSTVWTRSGSKLRTNSSCKPVSWSGLGHQRPS